jgi:NIMA-interacting peptidyl-prolyl cis-trans isomerase 1
MTILIKPITQAIREMNLPDGWELRESTQYPGRVFYYNRETCECTWIRPLPYPGYSKIWPPLCCVSQIWVKMKPEDPTKPSRISPRERASRKITEIYVQITESGQTIEAVQTKYPEAEIKSCTWIARGTEHPEFEDRAWRLGIGELSGPMEAPEGFYLILRLG